MGEEVVVMPLILASSQAVAGRATCASHSDETGKDTSNRSERIDPGVFASWRLGSATARTPRHQEAKWLPAL